ncbi:MAG: hypothetical protein BYD32DRAFT_405387 [Podila humilis]|nr:MAG: hypothetical protein BYD32DRAFT_405387 [Podila humilis]
MLLAVNHTATKRTCWERERKDFLWVHIGLNGLVGHPLLAVASQAFVCPYFSSFVDLDRPLPPFLFAFIPAQICSCVAHRRIFL